MPSDNQNKRINKTLRLVQNRTFVLLKLLGQNIYRFSYCRQDELVSPLHYFKLKPPFGLPQTPDRVFSKANVFVFLFLADLC